MKILSERYYLYCVPAALLLLTLVFRLSAGPFWLAGDSDPDYPYLLNSLNLSKGQAIGHIDHPGTPVQMLGALFLTLSKPFGSGDLTHRVLSNPETFLVILASILSILAACLLWYLGASVYAAYGSLFIALCTQLSLFCLWAEL